jgi:alkylhydroperoxidase family enzyme
MLRLMSHQLAPQEGAAPAVAPAILSLLACSPAALYAVQGLYAAAAQCNLDLRTCERICIALAHLNASAYSLAIHTRRGSIAGLTGDEMRANQSGTSHDARAAIAVELACALSVSVGRVSDEQLATARAAGYDDTQLIDIIALVCLSNLENVVGNVAGLGESDCAENGKSVCYA